MTSPEPATQRLHFWIGLLCALFFLISWAVLQSRLQEPVPLQEPVLNPGPDSPPPSTLIEHNVQVIHPPAPAGRGALPRSVVVMTVEYPIGNAASRRLHIPLPEAWRDHPDLSRGSTLIISLDESRKNPEPRLIRNASGALMVDAPTLHQLALQDHEHSRFTARMLLCMGIIALIFAAYAALRLRQPRPQVAGT